MNAGRHPRGVSAIGMLSAISDVLMSAKRIIRRGVRIAMLRNKG
jgi:hypothetical protein